jgi:hypothetical protein
MNAAKQWRDYAARYCDETWQITTLDAEIAAKNETPAAPTSQPAQTSATQELRTFMKWIAEHHGKLPSVENESCDGANDPEPGWCSAAAKESGSDEQHVSVLWFKDDPTAIEFTNSSALGGATELQCEDIGGTTIRRWTWGKSLTGKPLIFSHCRMTQAPLVQSGWHAVIKKVDHGSWVRVMSKGFLEHRKSSLHDFETLGTTL